MGTVQFRPGMRTIANGSPSSTLNSRFKAVQMVKKEREKMAALKRFGTWDGVVARCLLNIWGVIMFLRMGFIVGHAGIFHTSLIIGISLLVTVLSVTSLSAIATNGEVEGGGAYFLISRNLGASFGGSIGLIFSLANAVSMSMYLVGFAETVVNIYSGDDDQTEGSFIVDKRMDIRIWATVALVCLLGLACVGANAVVKFDLLQLLVLCIGIMAFFIGTFTTSEKESWAFTGYNSTTFKTNWYSDYRDGEDFMTVFSIFFPAVTGMMAGANISGELKNAQKSLPFGTMFAVWLSSLVYLGIGWILGATCNREGGKGGLYDDQLLMVRLAVWPPLVIVGIFASTLSSALAGWVNSP